MYDLFVNTRHADIDIEGAAPSFQPAEDGFALLAARVA